MSQKLFIALVRQYAREAQRRRRSYAALVLVLLQKYTDAIAQVGGTPEDYEKAEAWALSFVNREYGQNDRDWQKLPAD